jgi:uncharacterized membrane protein YfcA
MVRDSSRDSGFQHHREWWIPALPAALLGGGAGLFSGLSGVGGGVFLVPPLVALSWLSPKRAAALSPPYILFNSIVGLAAVLIAGQRLAPATAVYAMGALAGAILGTAIGLRWMSDRMTQFAMAAILAFAGIRLLLRSAGLSTAEDISGVGEAPHTRRERMVDSVLALARIIALTTE